MSETGTLKIHAKLRPEGKAEKAPPIIIEAPQPPRRPRRRMALTRGDRLLRNSALAFALLLGILALGNVDEPWARRASESVEQALTMRIDLDDSIGALEFVKNLMPESALVFMNLSGETALGRPVEGPLEHVYTNLQPWLVFNCPEDAPVRAAAAGTVTAVSPLSGGRFGVLVDHGEGVETLYARLSAVSVSPGDAVERGTALGKADGGAYFEYRKGGEAADPTGLLGL